MVRHLNKNDFIEMPWKNGKGKTLELFRLASENPNSFLFRISMATVSTDGPFSIFPFIDRTLFLVSGQGLILENQGQEIHVTEPWQAFHFAGEETITCRLIHGACQDFNIMVDRRYGKVETSTLSAMDQQFICEADFKFIYDAKSETLIVLEKGDHYSFSSETNSFLVISNLTLTV